MKRTLQTTLILLLTLQTMAQQSDSVRIRVTVDSCTLGVTVMNSQSKEFYYTVKNSSATYTLFSNGEKQIGFKCYVNRIIEDDEPITIVKCLFMEKRGGVWEQLTSGDYTPVKPYGNKVTIKSGSDKPVPDFFISYTLSLVGISDEKEDDTKISIPSEKPVSGNKN